MQATIDWLLKGDASIRWQVQRDLLDAKPGVYEQERGRVTSTGWGKRLLSKQGPDGNWDGGIYSPKWTSTTYTLLLLRDLGLPHENAQAQGACRNFFARGLERDGGVNLFKGIQYSEQCVNGMMLSLLAYFRSADQRVQDIAEFLMRQQMPDGGWNCRSVHGATHGSFHTTISVLEGLREYCEHTGGNAHVTASVQRAHEFLLNHRLYKSHRTGAVADAEMTRLHFPPRWHYDILRALDYFRSVRAGSDARMSDAIELLNAKQGMDGRWVVNRPYSGRVYFEMEASGKPSRWNTLRALRVLKWWNRGK